MGGLHPTMACLNGHGIYRLRNEVLANEKNLKSPVIRQSKARKIVLCIDIVQEFSNDETYFILLYTNLELRFI